MSKGKASLIIDLTLLFMSVLLTAGSKLIFHACGMTETGSYMSCHWAEQAVFATSLVLTVQAVLLLVLRRHGMKAGLALAMVPVAIVCVLTPGIMISLCMMQTMRCHTVMRPAVMMCGIVNAALALLSFWMHRSLCGKQHKKRTS